MTNPTVVVFDIGGVLLDWNPRHLYRKMLPDEKAVDDFLEEVDFSAWNIKQDAGRSWDDGVAELIERFPHRHSLITAAHSRWNEMIAGPIQDTVTLLRDLDAGQIPLYAITNFSAEKWPVATAQFGFLKLFQDVVVSGDEKILKPDTDIYDRLLKRNGLAAHDCLFVDDSPANVAGAEQIGMISVLFENPTGLRAALCKFGMIS